MTYGMNMLLWSGDVTGDEFLPIFERLKKMGFDTIETPFGTKENCLGVAVEFSFGRDQPDCVV